MGNDQRSGGSSSSTSPNKNKNKIINSSNNNNNNNNNNIEKPKQPQRGLGVAQLEKIRIHSQLASLGFIPQHPMFPNPFPISPFQEDMRVQAAYQQAAIMHSASLFGYGLSSNNPSSLYNNNFMMGVGGPMETTSNIRSQPSMTTSWIPNNNNIAMSDNQQLVQQEGMVTRHFLGHVERDCGRDNLIKSNGSSSHIFESNDENEELDLELKL